MTLTVTFSGVSNDFEPITRGTVTWDGTKFHCQGDPTLDIIPRMPIYGQHGKFFEPAEDPEGFMENLCYEYRSYPLMASRAVRTE